jgi:hypothetical protein
MLEESEDLVLELLRRIDRKVDGVVDRMGRVEVQPIIGSFLFLRSAGWPD